MPPPSLGFWTLDASSRSLADLAAKADDKPGPGAYESSELLPGPSALIAPEPLPKEEKATPGPASYDLRQSQAHIYPRGFAADLGAAREDPTQRVPAYVARYGPLEPQWEVTRARSPSATIPPEESCEVLRAQALMRGRAPASGTGFSVGPGAYDALTAPLLRPDRAVLAWRPLRSGLPEHLQALFGRLERQKPDSRPFLDVEADVLLRRRPAAPIILPLPKPRLRRSWSAGDIWRFYLPELDPPLGLANFARNLDFDDWQEHARRREELEARQARHRWPSLRLSYSLPDLRITHERAPEADFGLAQGRDCGKMEEDEDVEGDVLLLSLEAERRLLHPRAHGFVDMDRQLGRTDGRSEEVDDFEELILSPKRPAEHIPCFVDMARDTGRPAEPEMDPHIWAEDQHERVFCYKPLVGTAGEDEELDLPMKCLPPGPSTDFGRPVGRPGLDPRAPAEPMEDEDGDVLLLHWTPRFVPPPPPPPPPLLAPDEDATGIPPAPPPPPPPT
ncbi:unnamed protein product [Symbiodinium sp. CCMP2592]|nr:unnamed protein product [Symbiodinium sp. CCMP2592]